SEDRFSPEYYRDMIEKNLLNLTEEDNWKLTDAPDGSSGLLLLIKKEQQASLELRTALEAKEIVSSPSRLTIPVGRAFTDTVESIDLRFFSCLYLMDQQDCMPGLLDILLLGLMFRTSPNDERFVFLDKAGILGVYYDLPHLFDPPVLTEDGIRSALAWISDEITNRLTAMEARGARSLDGYNASLRVDEHSFMRLLVIITDADEIMKDPEFAAMMRMVREHGLMVGIHFLLMISEPAPQTALTKSTVYFKRAIDSESTIRRIIKKYQVKRGEHTPHFVDCCYTEQSDVDTISAYLKENNKISYAGIMGDAHKEEEQTEAQPVNKPQEAAAEDKQAPEKQNVLLFSFGNEPKVFEEDSSEAEPAMAENWKPQIQIPKIDSNAAVSKEPLRLKPVRRIQGYRSTIRSKQESGPDHADAAKRETVVMRNASSPKGPAPDAAQKTPSAPAGPSQEVQAPNVPVMAPEMPKVPAGKPETPESQTREFEIPRPKVRRPEIPESQADGPVVVQQRDRPNDFRVVPPKVVLDPVRAEETVKSDTGSQIPDETESNDKAPDSGAEPTHERRRSRSRDTRRQARRQQEKPASMPTLSFQPENQRVKPEFTRASEPVPGTEPASVEALSFQPTNQPVRAEFADAHESVPGTDAVSSGSFEPENKGVPTHSEQPEIHRANPVHVIPQVDINKLEAEPELQDEESEKPSGKKKRKGKVILPVILGAALLLGGTYAALRQTGIIHPLTEYLPGPGNGSKSSVAATATTTPTSVPTAEPKSTAAAVVTPVIQGSMLSSTGTRTSQPVTGNIPAFTMETTAPATNTVTAAPFVTAAPVVTAAPFVTAAPTATTASDVTNQEETTSAPAVTPAIVITGPRNLFDTTAEPTTEPTASELPAESEDDSTTTSQTTAGALNTMPAATQTPSSTSAPANRLNWPTSDWFELGTAKPSSGLQETSDEQTAADNVSGLKASPVKALDLEENRATAAPDAVMDGTDSQTETGTSAGQSGTSETTKAGTSQTGGSESATGTDGTAADEGTSGNSTAGTLQIRVLEDVRTESDNGTLSARSQGNGETSEKTDAGLTGDESTTLSADTSAKETTADSKTPETTTAAGLTESAGQAADTEAAETSGKAIVRLTSVPDGAVVEADTGTFGAAVQADTGSNQASADAANTTESASAPVVEAGTYTLPAYTTPDTDQLAASGTETQQSVSKDHYRVGDVGEDILLIKQRLTELGYYNEGSSFNDRFNNYMAMHVRNFQKDKGLSQTGEIGPEELAILFGEQP
ncbi:MAG: peptidoglycan-binding protein, partial [Clostridia bacterium]|nr:peptidoglycan-binding protein [Clostridia bacterium]